MARACEVCGKKTQVGNQLCRRGIAKKKGGIGIRITSREKRTFKPNIQKVKAMDGKTARRMKVCTRCIKGVSVAIGRLAHEWTPAGAASLRPAACAWDKGGASVEAVRLCGVRAPHLIGTSQGVRSLLEAEARERGFDGVA